MTWLFLLFACVQPTPENPAEGAPGAWLSTEPFQPFELVFDATGGQEPLPGGGGVFVPPGAVALDAELTVTCVPGGIPNTYQLLSEVCTVGPPGLELLEPVRFSIPYAEAETEPVYFTNTAGDGFEPMEAEWRSGLAEVRVTEPSTGFVAGGGPVQEVLFGREPIADILWVIDDSAYMTDEQERLLEALPSLHAGLSVSEVDWRIGVTTTDMESYNIDAGKLQRASREGQVYVWVDSTSSAQLQRLETLAEVGTRGSAEEKGSAAAYTLLDLQQQLPRNDGFERAGDLHIVFLSNEDDQSVQPSTDGFIAWMHEERAHPHVTTTHAVVGLPESNCANVFEVGYRYVEYAEATGGGTYDPCDLSYDAHLADLAHRITGAFHVVPLQFEPDVESLVVRRIEPSGQSLRFTPDRYHYDADRQEVVLHDVPAPGMQIWVDYLPR